jgi:UDP-glucose 4-epimerase
MNFLLLAGRRGFVESIMRVLVTGASGYLGARFARYIVNKLPGVELLLASRSGDCDWLEGLGVQVALDFERAGPLSIPTSIDAVVHLAATNEIDCVDVNKALQTNVNGTWRLIEGMANHSVKRFIYASTIHVYGELHGRLTESSPVSVKHPYGFTHQMAEQLFEYAAQRYSLDVTCLRFSNIIGAPVDARVNRWSLLVNGLCCQAVQSGRLEIKTPESRRDFITMTDASAAIERALINDSCRSGFDVFNIASGRSMSVREMADLIAARAQVLMKKDVKVHAPNAGSGLRQSDFFIENSKARTWGWAPACELVAEIDATITLCMEAAHV